MMTRNSAESEETKEIKNLKHHDKEELCVTRPLYRQGKKLTAVKVYTINNESTHLLIFGVPKINLRTELKQLCSKYGPIKTYGATNDYAVEIFTECFHICYERIQSARIAKRFLDAKSFYGGILHVCYAPELETITETRQKLVQRKRDVYFKNKNKSNKRKLEEHPDIIKIEDDTCNSNSKEIQDNYETTLKIDSNKKHKNSVGDVPSKKKVKLPACTVTETIDYASCQPVTEWISPKIIVKPQIAAQKINKIIFRKKDQSFT